MSEAPALIRDTVTPTAEVRLLATAPLGWHLDLLRLLSRDLAPRRVLLLRSPGHAGEESRLLRRLAPGLAPAAHEQAEPQHEAPHVTIALGATPPGPALVPLFDGRPGAAALLAALLAGRSPALAVVALPEGRVLAAGQAALDGAEDLAGAVEAVTARMAALLSAALRGVATPAGEAAPAPPPGMPGDAALLGDTLRRRSYGLVPRGYHLAFQPGHWRIGWRHVGAEDVWTRGDLGGVPWRVLASPPDTFFADPFPFTFGGRQWLFFEAFDHGARKGHIGAIACGPDGPTGRVLRVLEEPWHLSYPFVMEDEGEAWMIPESIAAGRVSLYRADPFPTRWVHETDLLTGIEASDATILRHEGRFWMFATVRDGAGSFSDMLWIHVAPRLTGPWRPHRANPVLVAGDGARPAGRLLLRGGRILRPTQLCLRHYGAGIGLAEVTRLDEGGFAQEMRGTLRPGRHWPGRKLHTLNRDGALEVIDGSAMVPRWSRAAALLRRR